MIDYYYMLSLTVIKHKAIASKLKLYYSVLSASLKQQVVDSIKEWISEWLKPNFHFCVAPMWQFYFPEDKKWKSHFL